MCHWDWDFAFALISATIKGCCCLWRWQQSPTDHSYCHPTIAVIIPNPFYTICFRYCLSDCPLCPNHSSRRRKHCCLFVISLPCHISSSPLFSVFLTLIDAASPFLSWHALVSFLGGEGRDRDVHSCLSWRSFCTSINLLFCCSYPTQTMENLKIRYECVISVHWEFMWFNKQHYFYTLPLY